MNAGATGSPSASTATSSAGHRWTSSANCPIAYRSGASSSRSTPFRQTPVRVPLVRVLAVRRSPGQGAGGQSAGGQAIPGQTAVNRSISGQSVSNSPPGQPTPGQTTSRSNRPRRALPHRSAARAARCGRAHREARIGVHASALERPHHEDALGIVHAENRCRSASTPDSPPIRPSAWSSWCAHELVHLLEPSHNARFHALLDEFCPDNRRGSSSTAPIASMPTLRAERDCDRVTNLRHRSRTGPTCNTELDGPRNRPHSAPCICQDKTHAQIPPNAQRTGECHALRETGTLHLRYSVHGQIFDQMWAIDAHPGTAFSVMVPSRRDPTEIRAPMIRASGDTYGAITRKSASAGS